MKLNEEITGLLGEENLAEETAVKLAALVESHVAAKLEEKTTGHAAEIQALNEAHAEEITALRTELTEQANSYAEYVKEEVSEKISEYVDAAVSKYVTENEEKFAKLDKFDRIEKSFELIKEAFENNGFDVKEDAVSSKLQEDVDAATAAYGHLFEQNKELKELLQEAQMENIFNTKTISLSDTQKEKVKALAESVQFEGVDQFGKALDLIVSQAVSKSSENQGSLNEDTQDVIPAVKPISDKMKKYIDRL